MATVGTIYNKKGMPVLTTIVANGMTERVSKTLHNSSYLPLATQSNKPPPTAPYVADQLQIGFMQNDSMAWTEDFSRCFGWVLKLAYEDPRCSAWPSS
ncbi:hypothetical protein IAQ67_18910 [Paenibacillus peoriae]|uniref:Uncharacterized protein n=1 Tax=Paenibacillus peoriae TaxID=59893 RepID=A0A7H0Y4B5_9BACL|nr:hypothetical protein AM598_02860 [Paenibacillus polymyxa]QNR65923.1 hypothetical protein IAQ67_18910 [Paenibacillus peoriae]